MLCIVSGSGNPVSDDNSQDKAMVHDRKMTLSMQLFHIINNTSFIDLLTLLYPFSCTSQSQTQTFSTTPTILCAIAKEIGGFDKISNLYYDGNWSEHWYARVTIGNQTKDYTFCPDVSTGDIGEIRKINFMDTSKMTKIY